jgi:hypothetical protein
MHKYALLEAEVKLLRDANKELSKRRKIKKKYLRYGGSLSFQEGRTFGTIKR